MEIVMKQEYDLEVVLLGIISIAALASFLGFHWVEAVVNITSINGDSNSSEYVVRQPGNTTVTNSTAHVKIGIGPNVVIAGGAAQTVTKSLTLNSLKLGGTMNASNYNITNVNALIIKNRATGANPSLYSKHSDQGLDINSTWIWQQAAAPIQYHVFRTTNPGSTGNALGGYYFEGYDASGTGIYFGDITGYEANVTASKTYGEIIVHANDNGTSDSYLILNYHGKQRIDSTKVLNMTNNKIISLGTPTKPTDAQNANHLGLLGNLTTSSCSVNQTLIFQKSNSTWICGVPSTFPSNVNIGGNIASTASS